MAAQLREVARESGQAFKQVVNETLRLGFQARPNAEPPPYKVRTRATGLRPGIQFDCVASLMEEIDGPVSR